MIKFAERLRNCEESAMSRRRAWQSFWVFKCAPIRAMKAATAGRIMRNWWPWRTTSASPRTICWGAATRMRRVTWDVGRRTAATGCLLPQGAGPARMHPPFLFCRAQKRNGPCTVQREKALGRAPVQWPSARRGSAYRCKRRFGLTFGHAILFCDSCDCRPVADGAEVVGVVVGLPLLLFPLPLRCVRARNVSGSGKRSRMYPCTSPGQRVPQGQGVSVPDFYKGVPAFPRRRQEVCACADRPAEHFFFSTGRGAFSF